MKITPDHSPTFRQVLTEVADAATPAHAVDEIAQEAERVPVQVRGMQTSVLPELLVLAQELGQKRD